MLRPIAQSPLQFLASEFEHIEEPMSSLMFGPGSTPIIEDSEYQRVFQKYRDQLIHQGYPREIADPYAKQYAVAALEQSDGSFSQFSHQPTNRLQPRALNQTPSPPRSLGWTTTTTKPWAAPFPLLSLRAASR